LEVGFVAQQAMRSQQSAQLPMLGFTQTGDANTGAGATCTHTSETANKMAENCFTNSINFQRNIADCKSFFCKGRHPNQSLQIAVKLHNALVESRAKRRKSSNSMPLRYLHTSDLVLLRIKPG
jgi:hypothetical protein